MKMMFAFTSLLLSLLISLFLSAVTGNVILSFSLGILLFALSFVKNLYPRGALFMAINSANISFAGGKNLGGTAGKFYYADVQDLVSWPAALNIDFDDAANAAALVTVPVGDPFVFKAGKCFNTIDCTLEEGEVIHKQIGVPESYAFENTYDNSYPGNDPDYLGMTAYCANRKLVVIAEELNGKFRVIGFPNYPARIEQNDGNSGKKVSDGRKNLLSFKCRGAVPAPIYLAPIPIVGA